MHLKQITEGENNIKLTEEESNSTVLIARTRSS